MRKLNVLVLIVACAAFAPPLAQAQPMQNANTALFDRLCADHGESSRHARFVDWLAHRLELNDAQKASFKEFQDARTQSLSDSKAKLCASKPDLSSFEGQLVFGQAFLEARLDAVKAENPKLIAFYNSLDERQKRIFDEIRAHSHRR
jgi:hypothetical protein